MSKYTVCFECTGGIEIEAESADNAEEIFNDMDESDIVKELMANGVTITEITEDDEPVQCNATYTSIWDGGIAVSSRCRIDKETHKIEYMDENDHNGDDGDLDNLEDEYVIFDDKPDEKVSFCRAENGEEEYKRNKIGGYTMNYSISNWMHDEAVCYIAHKFGEKETEKGFEFLQDYDYADMANAANECIKSCNMDEDFEQHVEEFFKTLQKESITNDAE